MQLIQHLAVRRHVGSVGCLPAVGGVSLPHIAPQVRGRRLRHGHAEHVRVRITPRAQCPQVALRQHLLRALIAQPVYAPAQRIGSVLRAGHALRKQQRHRCRYDHRRDQHLCRAAPPGAEGALIALSRRQQHSAAAQRRQQPFTADAAPQRQAQQHAVHAQPPPGRPRRQHAQRRAHSHADGDARPHSGHLIAGVRHIHHGLAALPLRQIPVHQTQQTVAHRRVKNGAEHRRRQQHAQRKQRQSVPPPGQRGGAYRRRHARQQEQPVHRHPHGAAHLPGYARQQQRRAQRRKQPSAALYSLVGAQRKARSRLCCHTFSSQYNSNSASRDA